MAFLTNEGRVDVQYAPVHWDKLGWMSSSQEYSVERGALKMVQRAHTLSRFLFSSLFWQSQRHWSFTKVRLLVVQSEEVREIHDDSILSDYLNDRFMILVLHHVLCIELLPCSSKTFCRPSPWPPFHYTPSTQPSLSYVFALLVCPWCKCAVSCSI